MLWRDLLAFQIYGANTNVGKTIISTLLCRAFQKPALPGATLYLKPVSTGPIEEADDDHIQRHVPNVSSRNLFRFSDPVSPHVAAARDAMTDKPPRDKVIISRVKNALSRHAQDGGKTAFLETAGGPMSPGPSGKPQADLYRPLRLPTILVGDSMLGGISTTISAFESLHVRGYDVDAVAVFEDPWLGNHSYLRDHFAKHGISTFWLPKPPPRVIDDPILDGIALSEYYDKTSEYPDIQRLHEHLQAKHVDRITSLSSMSIRANNTIWYPFTQHGLQSSTNLITTDSAYDDFFQTYSETKDSLGMDVLPSRSAAPPHSAEPLLKPLFDSSASWWTQGLGHGNPDLSLAAAYAAGRYGHVMFASAVHAPALNLSETLLQTLGNPRLRRVFFTDNGSTGMEVAVKMALRAACDRYNWDKEDGRVGILGIKGSYHGDTIGVMNCSEPSVFNKKVDWHEPWGWWFDPPSVLLHKGKWKIDIPSDMRSALDPNLTKDLTNFGSLEDVFGFEKRRVKEGEAYRKYIIETLRRLVEKEGRRFGALIMEPILMGAGGMIFVDPLFQRTLIEVVREHPDIFQDESSAAANKDPSSPRTPEDWSGLPVVADEVFTGLYRLGRPSAFSFLADPRGSGSYKSGSNPSTLSIAPDISVHAKLLTGGLLPLAITTASNSIFKAFLSDKKQDALLHGHSYTAHAIGCTVAEKSLDEMARMSAAGDWNGYKQSWTPKRPSATLAINESHLNHHANDLSNPLFWSFWSREVINMLSHSPNLMGVTALGTVLALHLEGTESGYSSNAAVSLKESLQSTESRPQDQTNAGVEDAPEDTDIGVHSRVLGNVLYLMTSLTSKEQDIRRIEEKLVRLLC